MGNPFASLVRRDLLQPNISGGTVDGDYTPSTEPAVDGFFAAYFEMHKSLKDVLFDTQEPPGDWTLLGLIQAITLPNFQLQKQTWQGYNDLKVHTPTTLEYETDTITLTMWDTNQSPRNLAGDPKNVSSPNFVLNTLTRWSLYMQTQSGKLLKNRAYYKANLVTILYDPSLVVPQFAVLFLGVFPIGVPLSSVQADITNVQLRSLQVSFSFDRMICDTELLNNVRKGGFQDQVRTLLHEGNVYRPTTISTGSSHPNPGNFSIDPTGTEIPSEIPIAEYDVSGLGKAILPKEDLEKVTYKSK